MVVRRPSLAVLFWLGTLAVLTACDNRLGELATSPTEIPAANTIPTTNTSTLEVRIESPANGSNVSGTVSISVRTKEAKVRRVRTDLFIGDVVVTSNTAERFTYSWNTTGYTGSQRITAVGWDAEGRSALAAITVTAPSSGGGGTDPPPPSNITPTSITLDPAVVTAGETSTGIVVLSSAAPAGGTEVAVRSNNTTAATVPAGGLVIPEGQTSGTFTVTTYPVASGTGLAISATSGGRTVTASFWINPAGTTLDSLTTDRLWMRSGETAQGTVKLSAPAPEGGASVTLSSSDVTRATVPSSVTVPEGQTTAAFSVTAQPVTVETAGAVTISGTYGGVTRTARLNIDPPGPGEGQLTSLTISPEQVVGGEPSQGTVTLGAAAGSDTRVTLTSTDPSVATVPPSVTVPAGAISATFTITTLVNNTGVGQSSHIMGEAGGVSRGASIRTTGAPTGPAVSAVRLFPSTVGGGGPATGIITFNGPITDGVLFDFSVSHPDIVTVLNFIGDGPAGERTVQRFWSSTERAFAITTRPVASNTPVTITVTACCGGVGQASATLTVTTDPPPPPDVVRVTRARWRPGGSGGTLEVTATSTSETALLTVYMVRLPDRYLMVLRPVGGGRYEGTQNFGGGMTNPDDIEVRSNLGGRATSRVR